MAESRDYDLLDEVNCADTCEAVIALRGLIDSLIKDIQHLELCISTRHLLSQHMDDEQGELLRMDILENLGRRFGDDPAYMLYKTRCIAAGILWSSTIILSRCARPVKGDIHVGIKKAWRSTCHLAFWMKPGCRAEPRIERGISIDPAKHPPCV